MKMTNKYNIGDKVWLCSPEKTNTIRHTCEHCGRYDTEYRHVYFVSPKQVNYLFYGIYEDKTVITYSLKEGLNYDEQHLFTTEEEALKRATELNNRS